MPLHDILGFVATLIAFIGYAPYLWATVKGTIRPHIFSWGVWGFSGGLVFAAQWVDGAGAGSWVMGFTALICFVIAGAALIHGGQRDISRSDWIGLGGALTGILLWALTSNPLWSVVIMLVADAMAFYPTFRKGWVKPHEDMIFTFACSSLKFMISMFALEHYSLTTVLFPAYLIIANGAFVLMVLWRRYRLSRS